MKKIFINGKIYNDDNMNQAFVCEDGVFKYVGNNEEALSFKDDDSDVIDLNGKFVLPGFNDSHMHLISLGNSLNMVDLYNTKSIDELIERGREFISGKTFSKDHFVMGFGWNDDYFEEKRFITRYDLDKISEDYPVCFIRTCYHIYVVNSKALELLGIDENTEQVEGGVFDLDENGKPLGIFRENACALVTDNITPLEFDEIKQCIVDGIEFCNSQGITSIGTDDLSEFGPIPYDVILKAFFDLEKEGKIKARINQQSRFHSFEEFQDFLAAGYRTGYGTDLFRIGPLKLISDGSLGARTAYLREPYADDKSTRGVLSISEEQLDKWLECGHENNMQIAVHAIGDGAMDVVINSYEKILKNTENNDFRHGIVHSQITNEDVIRKMCDLKLIAYIQTIFLDYDVTIAADRLGEHVNDSYRFASLIRRGIPSSNGSDAPVEWPDVMKGIQLGVTRKSITNPSDVFFEEEALTLKEAIDSFTKAGAYATFEENKKGRIAKGQLADFVIFENDLFEVNKEELANNRPLETWLGGKLVWQAQ